MGILAKTVPQMNVFVVGMPLKIGVGLNNIICNDSYIYKYYECNL